MDHYKIYSRDLLNNLFGHPYTKNEFSDRDPGVSGHTSANLNKLAKDKLPGKAKLGTGS